MQSVKSPICWLCTYQIVVKVFTRMLFRIVLLHISLWKPFNSSTLSLTGRFINFLNLLLFLLKFCTYLTIFKNHIFAMRKFLQSLCELYLGWKIFTSLKVCQITFGSNSWMTWWQLLCFTDKLRKCIGVFLFTVFPQVSTQVLMKKCKMVSMFT